MTDDLDTPSLPKYSCGNCRYAWAMEGSAASMCRRYPPSVYQSELDLKRDGTGKIMASSQTLSQFPIVMNANWCGEHKKRDGVRV